MRQRQNTYNLARLFCIQKKGRVSENALDNLLPFSTMKKGSFGAREDEIVPSLLGRKGATA
jgi:hypothetical protein